MITRELQPGGWLLYRPAVNVKACRPEWNEQTDFVSWVREHWPEDAGLMFHPVNEGDVTPQYRQKLIKAGLLSGVSDLIFMRSGWSWPAGVIEMKREWWKSKPSSEQKDYLDNCSRDGKFAAVCNGTDAAKCAFMDYKKGLRCEDARVKVALQLIAGGGK